MAGSRSVGPSSLDLTTFCPVSRVLPASTSWALARERLVVSPGLHAPTPNLVLALLVPDLSPWVNRPRGQLNLRYYSRRGPGQDQRGRCQGPVPAHRGALSGQPMCPGGPVSWPLRPCTGVTVTAATCRTGWNTAAPARSCWLLFKGTTQGKVWARVDRLHTFLRTGATRSVALMFKAASAATKKCPLLEP